MNAAPARLTVSVVVPVHNGAALLPRCINAIHASTFPLKEIIVVDDGSTDDSAAIARKLGCAVTATSAGPLGPARARNVAVAQATSDVVVFIDCDVVVAPDTIATLVAPFAEPDVVATFGSYDDDPASKRVSSLYANLRHHLVHQQGDREAGTFWSGCGAVRTKAFRNVGGFSADYAQPSIEDIELGARLRADGGRIRLVPEAQAKHLKDWTLRQLWRTDIWKRAVPWAQLMARKTSLTTDLNAGWSQRISAAAAHSVWFFALLAVIIHPGFFALTAATVFAWTLLNLPLLRLLARRGGLRAVVGGGLLHFIYYLYASVTLVAVFGVENWRRSDETPVRRRAVLAIIIIVLMFVAAAAVGLIAGLRDTNELHARALALEKYPDVTRFSVADIAAMQRRSIAVASVCLATALAIVWLGPRSVMRLADDAVGLWATRERCPSAHRFLILFATALTATLGALHLGQTMRIDEAASYLNYGTRPLFVGLSFYESTNNHVLHSALMRMSVWLFGSSPAAIRLPALLITVAATPAVYFASRTLFNASVGLLAMAVVCGCAYTIDLATNARGYPIVNLMFLIGLILLPHVCRGNRFALLAFSLACAVGLWAVPVMGYPIAILFCWLLFAGRRISGSEQWRPIVRTIAIAGMLILLFTITLYGPVFVVTGVPGYAAHAPLSESLAQPLASRAETMLINFRNAFHQFTYPAGFIGRLIIAAAVGLGIVAVWRRQPRGFALVWATVIGFLVAWLMSALAPLPWWSLTFLFPIVALIAGAGLAALTTRFRLRPEWLAPFLALTIAALTIRSDYPERFPHYGGFRDAPVVARQICDTRETSDLIVAKYKIAFTVNFYLRKYCDQRPPVRWDRRIAVDRIEAVHYINFRDAAPTPFQQELSETGFQLRKTESLPRSEIFFYERVRQIPMTTPSERQP